jgi:hypothetical protein
MQPSNANGVFGKVLASRNRKLEHMDGNRVYQALAMAARLFQTIAVQPVATPKY